MRTCTKCRQLKLESHFAFKSKRTGRLNTRCKECMRTMINTHYQENKSVYRLRTRLAKKRNAAFIKDYKMIHSCVDCGIEDFRVLDFDHLPQFTKRCEVSILALRGCSIKTLREEINKCELVCANCHRIRTYKRKLALLA